MIDESKVADVGALSPRAGVALMTLQLRSTLQEAIEAEAEVASVDVDAEMWQLRSRLGPLMEERRQALADDLSAERRQADAAVVAARAEADQIVADARDRADAAAEQAGRAEAAQHAAAALAARQAAIIAAVPLVTETPIVEQDAPIVDAPVALLAPPTAASLFVPTIDTPADDSPWAADLPVSTSTMILPVTVTDAPDGSTDPRTMHVVIDADSFARAFAAALAPVLEARNQVPVHPPQAYIPVQAPPAKKSFWAHAWHPDVLLSGLAMVIVIIVLVAWTG